MHNYTYYWSAPVNPDTGMKLDLVAGGGINDSSATYAAPNVPAASSRVYVVACRVCDEIRFPGGGKYGAEEAVGAGTVKVRLLGDANGDGRVTVTDFSAWKAQNGHTGERLSADFDGDGEVTVTDYSIWRANNGRAVAN